VGRKGKSIFARREWGGDEKSGLGETLFSRGGWNLHHKRGPQSALQRTKYLRPPFRKRAGRPQKEFELNGPERKTLDQDVVSSACRESSPHKRRKESSRVKNRKSLTSWEVYSFTANKTVWKTFKKSTCRNEKLKKRVLSKGLRPQVGGKLCPHVSEWGAKDRCLHNKRTGNTVCEEEWKTLRASPTTPGPLRPASSKIK